MNCHKNGDVCLMPLDWLYWLHSYPTSRKAMDFLIQVGNCLICQHISNTGGIFLHVWNNPFPSLTNNITVSVFSWLTYACSCMDHIIFHDLPPLYELFYKAIPLRKIDKLIFLTFFSQLLGWTRKIPSSNNIFMSWNQGFHLVLPQHSENKKVFPGLDVNWMQFDFFWYFEYWSYGCQGICELILWMRHIVEGDGSFLNWVKYLLYLLSRFWTSHSSAGWFMIKWNPWTSSNCLQAYNACFVFYNVVSSRELQLPNFCEVSTCPGY